MTVPVSFVGLDRLPDGEPRPVVSALHELGAALHVLGNPGHHGEPDWTVRVRATMTDALADETERWSWTTSAIRSQVFVTVPVLEEDIGLLDRQDPAAVAEALLRPLTRLGPTRTVLGWATSRGLAVSETVELLIADPPAGARRFAAFLRASWDEWYADEWRRVRPSLLDRAERFRRTVTAHGPAHALAGLHPAFQRRDPGAVVLAKVQNARHDVARRGLCVGPTAFGSPHVYVADVPRQSLLVLYPEQPDAAVPTVAEIRQRLTVLANPARLEVARAIAGEARTAGEIASLWRMDATAVTRHLRALSAAGLAAPERHGRFVRYRLDANAVRSLGADVLDLLQR